MDSGSKKDPCGSILLWQAMGHHRALLGLANDAGPQEVDLGHADDSHVESCRTCGRNRLWKVPELTFKDGVSAFSNVLFWSFLISFLLISIILIKHPDLIIYINIYLNIGQNMTRRMFSGAARPRRPSGALRNSTTRTRRRSELMTFLAEPRNSPRNSRHS